MDDLFKSLDIDKSEWLEDINTKFKVKLGMYINVLVSVEFKKIYIYMEYVMQEV